MKRVVITIFILSTIFGSALYAASEIQSFTNCTAAFAVVRELDGDVWYVTGQVFEAWGTAENQQDDPPGLDERFQRKRIGAPLPRPESQLT